MKQARRRHMAAATRAALLLLALSGCTASAPSAPLPLQTHGWTQTRGGHGGRVITVTTLRADGEGSLAEALAASGPRVIVFGVGGVIDLAGRTLKVQEPFVTIAGDTAPSPGITLIRGGLDLRTHDVIVQHLRIRPGEAGHAKHSGWEVDALSCGDGCVDVVVDHCSLTWATDENVGLWGDPFRGADETAWRRNNPHRITLSHNLIAEALDASTHRKGPHSKGMLVGDNSSDILIYGNLFASNVARNPELKGGVRAAVVNNYVVNPGASGMLYHMPLKRWRGQPPALGRVALVGNVMRHGPNTRRNVPLLRHAGIGDLELYESDNLAVDRNGRAVAVVRRGRHVVGRLRNSGAADLIPAGLLILPAAEVPPSVLRQAGARPWERDAIDLRIVRTAAAGAGRIPDAESEVGGYPAVDSD